MRNRYTAFSPVVYPRKLFVCKGSKKYVDEHFSNRDDTEIDVDYDDAKAWAHKVVCKDNGDLGILIWIDNTTPWDICHEVMHAVNAFVHDLGTCIPTYGDDGYEEFTCYLGGWIYKCVWEFKYGKA